ncbi:MAG: Arabinose metabolism transcriptional repressor [Anaerolineales bacterium]|nr:Arabinose metabolism transcriptional repressor [Anaerolineales bacterium]
MDRSSDVPLYLQACNLLTRRILDAEWEVGGRLPSEHELCAQLGISRGTLRQALAELEREGFVRREQGRGTFVIRGRAKQDNLDLPDRAIAFVVPYVRDSFAPTLLLGVEHAARERGYSVLFHHVENSPEKQAEILTRLEADGIAGIVLFPVDSVHVDAALSRLVECGYPLVIVDRYLKKLATDYVTADNFGGALRATQHLIRLGYRRIAFLTWRDPAVTMEHRQAGYERALTEAGFPLDPSLVCEVEGYPTIDVIPLCQLLDNASPPTAVFAANDQLALAVYKACRESNLCIPDDIALVGFDDLSVVAHLEIPLTTVAQPLLEMGRTAADIVIGRITGTAKGPQQHILPTHLVVRRSCGAHCARRAAMIGFSEGAPAPTVGDDGRVPGG